MKHFYKPLVIISICIILVIYLLTSEKILPSPAIQEVSKAQTTLSFSPNPILVSTDTGKASIIIDTRENIVNLIQIKFSYNPSIVYDLRIKKPQKLSNADELNNFVDDKKGTATFILNIPKEMKGLQGKEILAEMSFKTHLRDGDRTNLSFTKETMVTDTISPSSLLQKTINTQIIRKDN